jgi:hypothetical protein
VSDRFEDISRQLAGSTSRRGVLKMFGVAAGAAVAASVLKPFRGASAGVVCAGSGVAQAAPCQAGQTSCGSCCCKKGVACLDVNSSHCGCVAGTTPCGNACCTKGVACADPSNSICNGSVNSCNTGGAVCGSTCCPAGQCCNAGNVCGACSVCTTATGDICGGANACPGNNNCICTSRVGGGFFCSDAAGGGSCNVCVTDADCTAAGHPGFACVTASCCGGTGNTACVPVCPTGP